MPSQDYTQRARVTWGVFLILSPLLLVIWVAQQRAPSAATPMLWTLLGAAWAASGFLGLRYWVRARRARR